VDWSLQAHQRPSQFLRYGIQCPSKAKSEITSSIPRLCPVSVSGARISMLELLARSVDCWNVGIIRMADQIKTRVFSSFKIKSRVSLEMAYHACT
jgi:hypothetical protein